MWQDKGELDWVVKLGEEGNEYVLDKTDIRDSFLLPSDGGSTLTKTLSWLDDHGIVTLHNYVVMGPHGDKEEEEGSLKNVKTSADLLLPYLSKYE